MSATSGVTKIMIGKTFLRILGLSAIVGVPLFVHLTRGSFDEVDRCLDSGGCFDYSNGKCEYENPSRCGGPAEPVGVAAIVGRDVNRPAGSRASIISSSRPNRSRGHRQEP